MNRQLSNMMAEMESWEAAAEFGIPEAAWAQYQVRNRADDLYIACLSRIFDVLRLPKSTGKNTELAVLAKTLVIYSRSAAARHLSGVERRLNQLYSAALYYLAGFPATAMLLTSSLEVIEEPLAEESFLHGFLSRQINEENPFGAMLSCILQPDSMKDFGGLVTTLHEEMVAGLRDDPRKFIAAKLALSCIERFAEFNVWSALRQYAAHYSDELWQPFLGNPKVSPPWELLPSQLVAIRAGILGDGDETFSLQMPTSAGKTSLCELLIYHEVKIRKKRVLFLVPFRALAAEIREGMSKRLSNAGVQVIASHGGNIPTRSDTTTVENADVLIITPEKFSAMAQVVPGLENQYQTIICDEGHLIDDDSRGLQYELLLTKLRGTDAAPRKIIFISAILPNVNEIHEWLGGKPSHLAQSNYRPVETDYAFLTLQSTKNKSWQLDVNPIYERPRSYFLLNFLVKDDFQYLNPETGRKNLITGWDTKTSLACVTALKSRRNGSVALFTTQRNFIKFLAGKLIDLCESNTLAAQDSPPYSINLPELIEYIEFQFGQDYLLSRLLKHGIGFHHGRLPQEIRREMEEGIQNGTISILLCTTTLAEGVNLPIRTLVVHTVKRFAGERSGMQPLSNRSIKNIIGRAGRAGKETRGRVVFVDESERDMLETVLRDEAMESAHGSLYRLIVLINDFVTKNKILLDSSIIDQATDSGFLSIIDSIDFTLLDLIPSDTPQAEINSHIDELLSRTLAIRYCNTPQLQACIKTVFSLRAEKLQESVDRSIWLILRKTGASLRFWTFVQESGLLDHPLWVTLDDPMNKLWLNEVVIKLLEYPAINIEATPEILQSIIHSWMSGETYATMAINCECDVEEILDILSDQIGYRLQEHVAKLCQLAMAQHGEDVVSEVARNWPLLLQYGLRTTQQLDIFDRGGSERLAVWGVSRLLAENGIRFRRKDLMAYLRANGKEVRAYLDFDDQVPSLSVARLCRELKI